MLGLISLLVTATNVYALVLFLPSLHAWLWLPQVRRRPPFVRAVVFASFELDFAPRAVLRGAYITGFFLLIFSAGASLLTFRMSYRRAIAVAYGVALALIANELGVTLAFDIFYKDIHTPDPNVAFDVERLYRRTESMRAIVVGFALLIQAAYLRRFYARAAFVARTRARGLFSRKSSKD